MKKLTVIFLIWFASLNARGGEIFMESVFHRDIELAQWQPTTTIRTVTQTNGGAFAATGSWWYAVAPTSTIGQAAPSTSSNIVVAAVSNRVVVTWSPVQGAAGYRLFRGSTSSNLTNYVVLGSVTTYTDHGTNAWTVGVPTNTASAVWPIISIPPNFVSDDSNAVVPRWWIETYLIVSNKNDTLASVLARGSLASNIHFRLHGTSRVDATEFVGGGAGVSNVNAASLGGFTPATLPPNSGQSNRFMHVNALNGSTNVILSNNVQVVGSIIASGAVVAASFSGDGSGLSNVGSPFVATQLWFGVTNAGLGANQITNGTFTTDTLWQKSFSAIDTNTGILSFTPGTAGYGIYSNTLYLVNGRSYQLSWKQMVSNVNYAYVTLETPSGTSNLYYNINTALGSNTIYVRFLATSSNGLLRFDANPAPSGFFNLDDVSLTELQRGDAIFQDDVDVGDKITAGNATNSGNPDAVVNVGENDRRYFRWVTAPTSNSSPGVNGQAAFGTVGTTNWFYWYDGSALGSGTGSWLRTLGATGWTN